MYVYRYNQIRRYCIYPRRINIGFGDEGISDEGQGREALLFELAVLRGPVLEVPQMLLNCYAYYAD